MDYLNPLFEFVESFWKYFLRRNLYQNVDPSLIDAILKPACEYAFIAGWISQTCSAPASLPPYPGGSTTSVNGRITGAPHITQTVGQNRLRVGSGQASGVARPGR
jgi:hypothetical protein